LELELENNLLKAQGKPLLKNLEELQEQKEQEKEERKDQKKSGGEDDYLLNESEQLMDDFITLSHENRYEW